MGGYGKNTCKVLLNGSERKYIMLMYFPRDYFYDSLLPKTLIVELDEYSIVFHDRVLNAGYFIYVSETKSKPRLVRNIVYNLSMLCFMKNC